MMQMDKTFNKPVRNLPQHFLRHRVWIALLFSFAVLLLSEILHRAFTPQDTGLAFFPAHLLTAILAGMLFERILHAMLQRYAAAVENMRTISLMNHHIRNALEAITLSTYFMQNKSLVPTIVHSVERIDQALRLAEKGIRPMVADDREDKDSAASAMESSDVMGAGTLRQ
jgi:hypothetical protein